MKPSITDRIQSLRDTMGFGYTKPDPLKAETFAAALWENPEALEYLKSHRKLTLETIKHFKLGFDKSTHSISIPIYKNGELVNIKYRTLNQLSEQRYNGEKGAEAWLFNEGGVEAARKGGHVLVVEGEFDCMSAWQAGVKNVVSPSGGKDSYGVWLEQIDNIPRIYIAYDNDEGGRQASRKLAERLGNERCFEVVYQGAKDANEYLMSHTPEEFKGLLKNSKPFIRQQFKTVGDIINQLRAGTDNSLETEFVPKVKFQKGWMAIISGRSNVGKTSYVMNIANELANRGTGVLIMPFERGIESVGTRFLQVRHKSSPQDFAVLSGQDWDNLTEDALDLPVYFALPTKEETLDFIVKSKRYFDTQVVIIDHLDYMVRQIGSGNRGDAIMDTLQQLKRVAEESGVVLLIVSHVRKTEKPGEFIRRGKRPNIEDLKGSSALYQDPEVVVMLSETENEGEIYVDVLKNKGEMDGKIFQFNMATGEYAATLKHVKSTAEIARLEAEAEKAWNEVE